MELRQVEHLVKVTVINHVHNVLPGIVRFNLPTLVQLFVDKMFVLVKMEHWRVEYLVGLMEKKVVKVVKQVV